MLLEIQCPYCSQNYELNDSMTGQKLSCTCGVKFRLAVSYQKPIWVHTSAGDELKGLDDVKELLGSNIERRFLKCVTVNRVDWISYEDLLEFCTFNAEILEEPQKPQEKVRFNYIEDAPKLRNRPDSGSTAKPPEKTTAPKKQPSVRTNELQLRVNGREIEIRNPRVKLN